MSNVTEQMQRQFHNKAREIFFSLIDDFDAATANLNRRVEEYRFQQMKKEYIATLKKQLEVLALDILQFNKTGPHSDGLSHVFNQLIKDYLHRFVQKINFS